MVPNTPTGTCRGRPRQAPWPHGPCALTTPWALNRLIHVTVLAGVIWGPGHKNSCNWCAIPNTSSEAWSLTHPWAHGVLALVIMRHGAD